MRRASSMLALHRAAHRLSGGGRRRSRHRERLVIRPLYGRPLETLLATWGVSLILQQTIRMIFGPTNREVGNPSWPRAPSSLGQLSITYNRLWLVIFSLIASSSPSMPCSTRPGSACRCAPSPRTGAWPRPSASRRRGSGAHLRVGSASRGSPASAFRNRQRLARPRAELLDRQLHGGGSSAASATSGARWWPP